MTSPAPAYGADGGAGKIGAISVARFFCVLLSLLLKFCRNFGGLASTEGFLRAMRSSTRTSGTAQSPSSSLSLTCRHSQSLLMSSLHPSQPQIRLLCIDELMMRYFSWNPSTNILESFGRATFQSLKKLIGMLHARASVSLLLNIARATLCAPAASRSSLQSSWPTRLCFMSREFDNDAQRRAVSLAKSFLGAEGSAEGQAVSEELLGIIIAYCLVSSSRTSGFSPPQPFKTSSANTVQNWLS